MSLKNITLRINDASDIVQTHQIAGGTGGAGSRGQALRLKALANVKYHFTDEATGFAPENLATKRVGKDLHIAFEGGQVGQPDLVIEDYYQDDGAIGYAEGSDNLLVGTHENGQTYPFVPESAQASDAVSQLAEGIQAGQALGISHAPVPPQAPPARIACPAWPPAADTVRACASSARAAGVPLGPPARAVRHLAPHVPTQRARLRHRRS